MLAVFNNGPGSPTLEIGFSILQPGVIAPIPPPQGITWINAIADTGATGTCICASAALRAGLPVIGMGQIQSASHIVPVNLYFGDLWIRGRNVGGPMFEWRFSNRTFSELALPGATHEALLGMDIFREGMLMVHGPEGKTTFAW